MTAAGRYPIMRAGSYGSPIARCGMMIGGRLAFNPLSTLAAFVSIPTHADSIPFLPTSI